MRTIPKIEFGPYSSQALEYERRYADQRLDSFYDSSIPKLNHPEVKAWGADLMNERQELLQGRGDEKTQVTSSSLDT